MGQSLQEPFLAFVRFGCFEQALDLGQWRAWHSAAVNRLSSLTSRERQIMELVLAGDLTKNIAADLGVSQRTIENHRASIMRKAGTKSLPGLTRLAFVAAWHDADEQTKRDAEEYHSNRPVVPGVPPKNHPH